MNLIEMLSFSSLKLLAEQKLLVIFTLLLSAAMKNFQVVNKLVDSQLSVDDLTLFIGSDKEEVKQRLKYLESLKLVKMTGSHICVGKIVDDQFYLLNEKVPQKTMPSTITGRYIPLAKKEEDYEIVDLLVKMNRLFFKKFQFSETTNLLKQLNNLKHIYNTSETNLKQIYNAYEYFLSNYKNVGANAPTIPAFNGFFGAIMIAYKQADVKSYDRKEESTSSEVFSGYLGRHYE